MNEKLTYLDYRNNMSFDDALGFITGNIEVFEVNTLDGEESHVGDVLFHLINANNYSDVEELLSCADLLSADAFSALLLLNDYVRRKKYKSIEKCSIFYIQDIEIDNKYNNMKERIFNEVINEIKSQSKVFSVDYLLFIVGENEVDNLLFLKEGFLKHQKDKFPDLLIYEHENYKK